MLVLLGMLNAFSLFKHLIIQTENLYHLQHAFVVVISQLSTCAFSASSILAPYLHNFFAVVQIMNFFGAVWDSGDIWDEFSMKATIFNARLPLF